MRRVILAAVLLSGCGGRVETSPPPTRADVESALKRAVDFYLNEVSTEGGYHFRYTADLSFGRSESAQGPTQVSVQRDGTPRVGMAYLEAHEALGDPAYLEAARAAARALVRGQLCSGGWNYLIEFDAAKRGEHAYVADGACESVGDRDNTTTLDDNVSQAALRLLIRVDRLLDFEDAAIHGAAARGLDALIRAQYPNGAWPQRYSAFPVPADYPLLPASYPDGWSKQWPNENYRGYYTFNDNSIADDIDLFLEAARSYSDVRYLETARRGGDFILLAQMPDPQPAWAQQYDRDMHPAWARVFEPPSITASESLANMMALLALYRETGDRKYLDPLPRALEYLKSSALPDDADPPARRSRTCPPGARCLARFYELETNRPLFITRGTMIRVQGQSVLRPDGYEVVYDDDRTITHYSLWTNGDALDRIERAYSELAAAADPAAMRRPDKLHGLSPWQTIEAPPEPDAGRLAAAAEKLLAEMDERGAWVEQGFAGRAEMAASVYAAAPMTIRIGDFVLPLPEDETVEVFHGSAPVIESMIVSSTFARNIETLAAYCKTL